MFKKKVDIFSYDVLKTSLYLDKSKDLNLNDVFTEKVYSILFSSSKFLEDFLDFHGAKNNKDWYFYRELIATIRHLSLGAYAQKHIQNRFPFYKIKQLTGFNLDSKIASEFFKNAIINLCPVILDEAKKLEITIPNEKYKEEELSGIVTNDLLENNIQDVGPSESKEKIIKINNQLLNIIKEFESVAIHKQYKSHDIKEIVPNKINVVLVRRFEMMLHNLQSYFDSYVIFHGGFRGNEAKARLMSFRGYVSITFHLLSITSSLLHYYERHLYDMGYKAIYKKTALRLSKIVNEDMLLDCTINYGLFYTTLFLKEAKEESQKVLEETIEKSFIVVQAPKNRGFHFRPSTLVSAVVNNYGGKVTLHIGEKQFDAGSVLELTWAGGLIKQENVQEIKFSGDIRALKDLKILANIDYGEDLMGTHIEMPKELAYLK